MGATLGVDLVSNWHLFIFFLLFFSWITATRQSKEGVLRVYEARETRGILLIVFVSICFFFSSLPSPRRRPESRACLVVFISFSSGEGLLMLVLLLLLYVPLDERLRSPSVGACLFPLFCYFFLFTEKRV
ncbi:hypothetical protein F5X99DRAFT_168410 [Biscogniauxia marginata]|nr:hypothetical protein F5X99DRAFT_168410 [Biscogniauxia marginata]